MFSRISRLLCSLSLPFRLPRRYVARALLLTLWLGFVATVLATDQPVEEAWDLVGDDVAALDGAALFLTLLVRAHLIALGLLLLCILDRRVRWRLMREAAWLMVGQAMLCSGLKQFFGRLRPDVAAEATIFYGPTLTDISFSFPSGHATAAWALAGLLSIYYPRWRWGFMACAAAVCLARVQLDRHFPSDVLAGGLLGWYLATWMLQWLRRPRGKEGQAVEAMTA